MATKEAIWTKVKTTLENDSTLSAYIKKVHEGVNPKLFEAPKPHFPCIFMEDGSSSEEIKAFPYQVTVTYSIILYLFLYVYDYAKQIRGDDETKGIMDIEEDIKKALGADPSLGSVGIIMFEFPRSEPQIEGFPFRGRLIEMKIQFEQNFKTRG